MPACRDPARLAAAALALAGLALAVLAPSRPTAAETVTFATVDWPPFYGSGLDGGGPVARVTRAAMAEAGYEAEITFTAWQRTLNLVEAGEVDFMMGAYVTDDRRQRFRFTEPLLATRDVIIAHKDTGVSQFDTLASLAEYRIGVGRGWDFGPRLEQARDSLTLVESPDTATLVRQLARRRIDMMIETEAVARTTAERIESADMADFVVLEPAFRKSQVANGIADDHPRADELVAAFNAGLAALQADGRLAELMPPERFTVPLLADES